MVITNGQITIFVADANDNNITRKSARSHEKGKQNGITTILPEANRKYQIDGCQLVSQT